MQGCEEGWIFDVVHSGLNPLILNHHVVESTLCILHFLSSVLHLRTLGRGLVSLSNGITLGWSFHWVMHLEQLVDS